jgi:hypothetical protein
LGAAGGIISQPRGCGLGQSPNAGLRPRTLDRVVGLPILLSLASLPASTAKQPNRASRSGSWNRDLATLSWRSLAEWGLGSDSGWTARERNVLGRSLRGLKGEDSVILARRFAADDAQGAAHVSGVERDIAGNYRLEQSFPATIGGGNQRVETRAMKASATAGIVSERRTRQRLRLRLFVLAAAVLLIILAGRGSDSIEVRHGRRDGGRAARRI